MNKDIDIYSKSGLNSLLNPASLPDNPFESGSEVSDEEKYGNTNEFARHPALTNGFADLSVLDQPMGSPGGKQPDQPVIPTKSGIETTSKSIQPPLSNDIPSPGDLTMMDQLLGVMTNSLELRMQFCSKVAQLMVENADIMQNIMGQLTQVFNNK